jgi:DNA transposition AAA+ family ATPase
MLKTSSQTNGAGAPNESEAAPPNERQIEVAESRSTITVGGDQVTAATRDLPDDQREAIRWLYSLARSQGWGLTRLKEETGRGADAGIDTSTLYRIFNGTYKGVLANIVARIEKYRAQFEDKANRSRDVFVETSVSKKVFQACKYARDTHTLVFVYGPTQHGKTTALKEFAAQNNHGATKYVRMPASAGVQLMMKEFARACYVSPKSCFENLREYVMNAIDSTHLVIVDELHQAFLSYQRGSAIKCLEVIREIHDRTGCGMVLAGTNKLESELMLGEHRDLLGQFRERGVLEVQLPTALKGKDLLKIAAAFGLAEPTGTAADMVAEITKGRGLKRYVTFLKNGRDLAALEKARRMTWDYFVRAHDIVADLKNGKYTARTQR